MERSIRQELIRKLLHLPTFAFPFIALYSKAVAIVSLLLLAAAYLSVIALEGKRDIRTPLFSAVINYCKRNSTYDWGPFYLALGLAAALYISKPTQAFFAAYVIAISDSFASIIGMRFGKRTIPYLNKSMLGSLAFFVTCFVGALYYLPPVQALITAACLSVIELVSIRGLDNLTLPIASQLLLLFL